MSHERTIMLFTFFMIGLVALSAVVVALIP